MSAQGVLRIIEGGSLAFWCPGCQSMHAVNDGWKFNGDYDKPTFTPSILVTGGHYIKEWKGPNCWCTWNRDHPDNQTDFKCVRCHSYVTNGKIQFLSDCSHELVNQAVDLIAEWDTW